MTTDFTLDQYIHNFRTLVFAGIAKALNQDGTHKPYEGAIELNMVWPNYFVPGTARPIYHLHLHCYVLGPGRHYSWSGTDPKAVFAEASGDVADWIKELFDDAP